MRARRTAQSMDRVRSIRVGLVAPMLRTARAARENTATGYAALNHSVARADPATSWVAQAQSDVVGTRANFAARFRHPALRATTWERVSVSIRAAEIPWSAIVAVFAAIRKAPISGAAVAAHMEDATLVRSIPRKCAASSPTAGLAASWAKPAHSGQDSGQTATRNFYRTWTPL